MRIHFPELDATTTSGGQEPPAWAKVNSERNFRRGAKRESLFSGCAVVNFQRAIFVVYCEESSIWANFHRDSPQAAGWDTIECAGILIRRGVPDAEYSPNI